VTGEVLRFPQRPPRVSPERGPTAARALLAIPQPERLKRPSELNLEDPEVLLSVTQQLTPRIEAAPSDIRDEAEFFFRFLESPQRPIGDFDERDYFLGEFALMAGTCSRLLFRRDEARAWLDRAEAFFVQCAGASSLSVRVAYQRLALAIEERKFEQIFELAPLWAQSAARLGMFEEGLKCRLLVALALIERDRLDDAVEQLEEIRRDSASTGVLRLEALSITNLAQIYRSLGRLEDAMAAARTALPLLVRLDHQIGLMKLRWYMGDVLRDQGNPTEALETYRASREDAERLGLRGDVAAIHLITGELLLDMNLDAQAEWEIRAALPIIDEEKMVPEGFAALSLLRESLRRRKIDRGALRTLHGYFKE
jgi:tetratricopeptide (TPR) repeat protein